jgi:hypothetical protein
MNMTSHEKIIIFAAMFSAILYGVAQICTIVARLIPAGKLQTILFYIGHDAKAVADIIASIAPRGTSPNSPEISPPNASTPTPPLPPSAPPAAPAAPPAAPAAPPAAPATPPAAPATPPAAPATPPAAPPAAPPPAPTTPDAPPSPER